MSAAMRDRRRQAVSILLGAWLAALPAPAAAAPPAAELVALRLWPQDVTLRGAKAAQRFVVLGSYADGFERDVTGQCRWAVSDPALAAVDGARVAPKADGAFEVRATLGGKTARARVRAAGTREPRPFSFARDVGGILTRRGCNTADCHGSVKGKKGFKLSLGAAYPREDYKWIVEGGYYHVLTDEQTEPKKPRINRKQPEKSLLLAKPTLAVSHGGGERLAAGSPEYQAVLNWIKGGAPYGADAAEPAAAVAGLEVYPPEVVLDPRGHQQLLVTAVYADGHREDVTDQVMFGSNNDTVAAVSPAGVVKAVRPGETAVMVRAAGQFATARVGVIAAPIRDYPEVKGRNLIDAHVFAKLRKFNLVPSGPSGDAEFLRRVALDLTGTLPPPQRVREFVADADPGKRDKLIETLMNSPEYVDFWAYRLGDLLRVYFSAQENLKNTYLYMEWVRQAVAQNKPYDQIARERIAAQGYGGVIQHFYRIGSMTTPAEIMAEQFRVFQGLRLECAQCHNHPFEAWSQDQFWGLAAFFGQLVENADKTMVVDFPVGLDGFKSGRSVAHPRTKREVKPAFLDGRAPAGLKQTDLRMALARWMTAKDNPYFAKAAVNRVWGYFFGRGIVDPVDDFRSTNPPTHPALLAALARDFQEHGYDLKHLVRLIVQSRTYQLSGTANATNRDDAINYARSRPRALEAVVLLDAVSRVTGVPEAFAFDKFVGGGATPPGTRAIQLVPDITPSQFLEVYGRPNRQTLPERDDAPALGQALHMLVGATYSEKITKEGGRVDRLLKRGASDREAVEELYLAALGRLPTARERNELAALLRRQPSRRDGLAALTWALLCSREFAYNH
jgi:hypothetical protein